MKKILLFFFSMTMSTSHAQKVVVDRMAADGRHEVQTNMKNFTIEGIDYSMALRAYESKDRLEWIFMVSSPNNIPQDMIVLFKLGNNNTIKLTVDSLREAAVTTNSVTYNYGNYGAVTRPGVTRTYYISESHMDSKNFEDIVTNGISKVRMGNNVNFIEQEWTNNPLGKFLAKCRKKITERIQTTKGSKKDNGSIYDDF